MVGERGMFLSIAERNSWGVKERVKMIVLCASLFSPQDDRSAWTANLDPGPDCSIGQSTNEALNWDGTASSGRPNEDR